MLSEWVCSSKILGDFIVGKKMLSICRMSLASFGPFCRCNGFVPAVPGGDEYPQAVGGVTGGFLEAPGVERVEVALIGRAATGGGIREDVMDGEQTAGRGRRGRSWASPRP